MNTSPSGPQHRLEHQQIIDDVLMQNVEVAQRVTHVIEHAQKQHDVYASALTWNSLWCACCTRLSADAIAAPPGMRAARTAAGARSDLYVYAARRRTAPGQHRDILRQFVPEFLLASATDRCRRRRPVDDGRKGLREYSLQPA
jgi:hypothetical protein